MVQISACFAFPPIRAGVDEVLIVSGVRTLRNRKRSPVLCSCRAALDVHARPCPDEIPNAPNSPCVEFPRECRPRSVMFDVSHRPSLVRNCLHCSMWNITWTRIHSMETIHIVLDKKLLQATDRAARQTKRTRSALVRDALREHLRSLEVRAREASDRQGYSRQPQRTGESRVWEAEAAWPPE